MYGRRAKLKARKQVEAVVEFSPEKLEDHTFNSQDIHKYSDEFDISSNFPIQHDQSMKDNDGFELAEVSPIKPIGTKKKKVDNSSSLIQSPEFMIQTKTTTQHLSATQPNKLFIESKSKPKWSPSVSPSRSSPCTPKSIKRIATLEASPSSPSRRKAIQTLAHKKRLPKPILDSNVGWDLLDQIDGKSIKTPNKLEIGNEAWELLDNIYENSEVNKLSRKKLLFNYKDKQLDEEFELMNNDHNNLFELLNSQPDEKYNTNGGAEDDNIGEIDRKTQKATQDAEIDSYRVNRTNRTYGLQRSYRSERGSSDKNENRDDYENLIITEERNHGHSQSDVKTMNNLKAQGESAQFLDELNFILEGIESEPSLSNLLELALKMFDDQFLKSLKNYGMPPLHKFIKMEDRWQCHILGFIYTRISEEENYNLEFSDIEMLQLVQTLMTTDKLRYDSVNSKRIKCILKDFQNRLKNDYSSLFFGASILFQNEFFINDQLLQFSVKAIDSLDFRDEADTKILNMLLIIYEKYLAGFKVVPKSFEKIIPTLINLKVEYDISVTLLLKVFISLAVKKSHYIFDARLVTYSINHLLSSSNEDTQILSSGLLINLVEDTKCFAEIGKSLSDIHRIYSNVQGASSGYYAFLLATIYLEDPTLVEKEFDETELQHIKLELMKFDVKGNKLVKLQIEDILTKINDLY
ncbi:hypothetical protein WICMUC_002893 [Wickerhamomyces mucosus]|uniref:Wings apart-like protein C-terminal domain-containing protein n=1 Tax=Wickerhamomyces mucosus TaxID=1378264 RepID=A0A9P8TDF4_9ASCO|nr:hypothetical protein WICMUC_002893 [Wickerhamomyces mucosus]